MKEGERMGKELRRDVYMGQLYPRTVVIMYCKYVLRETIFKSSAKIKMQYVTKFLNSTLRIINKLANK